MKKNQKILAVLTTMLAAQFSVAAPTMENTISAEGKTGYKHVKSVGYEDLGFGVGVKNDLKLNDSHHIVVGIDGYKSSSDSYSFDGDTGRAKGKEFDLKANYKYDIPINYSLIVTPKVGVGYAENKMKFDGQRNDLKRGYGEVGAEAKYTINQDWALVPSLVYQRDFNSKEKFNGTGLKDPSWGQKVEAEFGVSKKFAVGDLKVSPYYSRYKNNTSEAMNKIEDAGVKVNYNY